jgi:flagellin
MLGGVASLTQNLAAIFNQNNTRLADVLQRIATGKKVNVPSDNFSAFSRAASMLNDVEQFARVKENLTEAKAYADVAVDAGNSIYEDLDRMQELNTLYNTSGATTEDKAAYTAEFNTLKSAIARTITNSNYDGTHLVATGTAISVATDPGNHGAFSVDFAAGDIPSATALTIGAGTTISAAIQTQLDTATLYVVKAESYSEHATRQLALTDTIIQSKKSVISMITDIDEAEELSQQTDLVIRQQASVAMLAQANLVQSLVSQLYRSDK